MGKMDTSRRRGGRRTRDSRSKAARPAARRSLGATTTRLLQLADDLQRARVLEDSLQAVTEVAVALTRSHQSTLRLLDEGGTRLLTSARTGPSVHRRGARPFRPGEGFIGWVVAHRRAALTNRVGSDPRFVARAGQMWTPTAVMAVPLRSGTACTGVLSVSRRDGIAYRELDLDLLRLVVQLSAPHLEIARLKRLNQSDPLTLLHNRRHLQERLPEEIGRARRSGRPLAVAMLDIDHFKRVNDELGHDIGDEVLCGVADRLRHLSRSSDVVARWGGEEFLAIFPETNLRQGRIIAERIRRAIECDPFRSAAGSLPLTVSLGLSTLGAKDDETSLVQRVDQALLEAKRQGRNRVVTISSRTRHAKLSTRDRPG